ncbi:MAG: protein tyrosine kinase [Betaproteobacteria bacterium RBG_16_58_11]|nr:MAG: protein tyrosine kinase [Betaproteobacteria bacterium RBG_16_58_11]OFZ96961.1 MAG: protein tyrosine kinase [Betaproteobacteria bacterium RBG_19FT_COMBO_58_11]
MSIIEKALNKVGDKPQAEIEPPQPAPIAVDTSAGSLVEQAVAKIEIKAEAPRQTSGSRPAAAAPADSAETFTSRQVNIDFARLRARGLLTSDDERSALAEEYRMIKRPLLANAFGTNPVKNGNLIMVTSSLPGEGKTFTAINLAISIAMELDRTVLLVDADVAHPRMPEYLGFRAEHGLLDILRQDTRDLSNMILRTNIDKLSILPAGRTYARATELLASEAMDRLIADLSNRYPDRLVLFDSPPLLATSEAGVLASHMGQIVMVAEADKTPKNALREALTRLEGACDVIGMVLNKSASHNAGGYGYYGYGGYGKQYGKQTE